MVIKSRDQAKKNTYLRGVGLYVFSSERSWSIVFHPGIKHPDQTNNNEIMTIKVEIVVFRILPILRKKTNIYFLMGGGG